MLRSNKDHVAPRARSTNAAKFTDFSPHVQVMKKPTQRIRYVRTTDGVQLAWADAGTDR